MASPLFSPIYMGLAGPEAAEQVAQSWESARMGFHGHDRCFGRHLNYSPAAKKQNEEQVPHRKGVPAPSWSHGHSQRPSWQGLVTLLAWGRAFSTARSFEADTGASAAESQAQPAPPRNIAGPWKKQTCYDHLIPSPSTIRPAPFCTSTRSVGTPPPTHTHKHTCHPAAADPAPEAPSSLDLLRICPIGSVGE